MKKLLSLILVIVLVVLAAGCSSSTPSSVTDPTQKPAENTSAPAEEEPTAEPSENEPTEAAEPVGTAEEEPTAEPSENEPTEAAEPVGTAYEVSYTNALVYKNSIGTYWVHVVVQIENTGSDPLYLSTSTIDLEDADEHLVDTIELVSPYPEVLLPGETALLADDTTLDEDPGVETLTVLPHVQAKKATVECIRLETSDEELFTDKYYGIKLKGRVKNTSDEVQKLVYVIANLYDADHHGIGQLMTIVTNDIAAGDKVGFELSSLSMPDSITEESVASFEVFAFPTQYQFDW